jgi:hypothetical protein
MALFNAFVNSKQSGGADYPVVAAPTGPGHDGANVRKTIVGLEFAGPRTIWGGKVNGSVYMDFFAGATNSAMRIRTASIELSWKTRSITAGLEKPIFNPREPSSLAQVGIFAADRRGESVVGCRKCARTGSAFQRDHRRAGAGGRGADARSVRMWGHLCRKGRAPQQKGGSTSTT